MVLQDLKRRLKNCSGNNIDFQPDEFLRKQYTEKGMKNLLDYGVWIENKKLAKSCFIETNACHDNAVQLAKENERYCHFTGFGLLKSGGKKWPGRWFVHSWIVDPDNNQVLETTGIPEYAIEGWYGLPLLDPDNVRKHCLETFEKFRGVDDTVGCRNKRKMQSKQRKRS